jgi:hypothetical protein
MLFAAAIMLHRTRVVLANKRMEARMGLHEEGMAVSRPTDYDQFGFFVLDQRWCFTYVNEAAEAILRRTHGKALGAKIWEVFPQLSGSDCRSALQDAVSRQNSVVFRGIRLESDVLYNVHAFPIEGRLMLILVNSPEACPPELAVHQLDQIRDSAACTPPVPSSTALSPSAFCDLAIDRAFASLLDVKSLTEALISEVDIDGSRSACHLLDCPRLTSLTAALQEAVRVLEMTKGSFRSRELGDLRKRLEEVIRD